MSEPIVVKLACCNNIDCATITLKTNATTVLHGMNGSGKSSVAKALILIFIATASGLSATRCAES